MGEESFRVAKEDGTKEEFDPGKLWNSLYYPARESHYGEDEAVDLADEAKRKVVESLEQMDENVFTTSEIRSEAIEALEEIDTDVALMYETHLDLS